MTTEQILTGIKDWVLSKLSLKQDVISDLATIRSGAQAGTTAVQPSDLSEYFNDASYDTSTHRINFYHGQNIVAYVDASPFIVDGMVDDVRIENGYLVIDFNTESGKQDISIPLTDIFDPSNYYNKTQTDALLGNKVDKVSGKGLSTNDYTNAEKEKLSGLQNYDDTQVRQLIGRKQDIIQDLEDIRSGASAGASAVQPSTLNSALSDTVAESGVYDVTANNNNAKFASLSALLGSENLDTLIPSAKRKGGMSIKFIQSSDNKYVQYFLIKNVWSASAGDWEKVNLEVDVTELQDVQDALLVITPKTTITKTDFSLDGIYKTTEMTIGSNSDYKSTPIYNVTPGDVFVWVDFPTVPQSPFSASLYDENGEPVVPSGHGNNRLIAYYDTQSSAGFVIPDGVKKIGFVWDVGNYPLTWKSKITSGNDSFALTQEAKDLLNEELGITEINEDIQDVGEVAEKAQDDIDLILESIPATKKTPSDFTTTGRWKSGVAEIDPSYSKYRAIALLDVVEGQVITWHKWQHGGNIMATVSAIFCYDNDGLPYDGSSARINYESLTTHNYNTGEFTFKIPSNCSQIGLAYNFTAYPTQEGAEIIISEGSVELTDFAKELINNAVEQGDEVNNDSAKYYLKGNSNITYDVSKKLGIIAAGQSNIDGRNSYSDYPYLSTNPNSKVHFKNSAAAFSSFEVTNGGQNNDWSFDAIVYNLLTESSHGNLSDIYVMKHSMGGTSIDPMGATDYHWTADYEFLTSQTYSLLRSFESIVRGGIASDGSNFEIKAMLWHQGEGDMQNEQVANRYYENLKNMLAYVRGVVGNPRLYVFCGNISLNRTSLGYVTKINAAYTKLASEDPYLKVVDMSNAQLEDGYHFNYEWSIYFGQKVYDLMIDAGIITGTKINPSEPS